MYAELSNLRMYYEEHGSDRHPPVVLLHGGMSGAQTWQLQVEALRSRYRVLMPEQQGHCHTHDIDRPLSYETMADDTIEFLDRVAAGSAHVVGHSDGGILALIIAMRRPDLVDRAVAIGANFHKDGLLMPGLDDAGADDEEFATQRERFSELSPDGPERWPVVFEKTRRMWLEEPTMTLADMAGVARPVLVLVGDDDVIDHRHSVDLYEALPEGQLAIVPGTSHRLHKEKPELVNQLILDFLGDDRLPSSLRTVRV